MTQKDAFRCLLLSGEVKSTKSEGKESASARFTQEEGKKSSFLLDPKSPLGISKPAHLIIDYPTKDENGSDVKDNQLFFLGGFTIVTNAKHCEVYLTDKDGKEDYLTTSKGITFEKGDSGEEWFKAVCVVPGGPRPVLGLHIKLLSIKPSGATSAFVKSMKLTARLPAAATPTAPKAASASSSQQAIPSAPTAAPTTPPPTPNTPSPGISQADLGAAMASLSIMARSTEAEIEKEMASKFLKLEEHFNTRWNRMEQHFVSLTSVVASQKATLADNHKVLEMQQNMLHSQTEQIQLLLEQQTALTQTVQSLTANLTELRTSVNEVASKCEESARSAVEETHKTLTEKFAPTEPTPQEAKNDPPRTPAAEDEEIAEGIEHTLSSLDLSSDENDHVPAEPSATDGQADENESTEEVAPTSPMSDCKDSTATKDGNDGDDCVEDERIEVSLLSNEKESLEEQVHEERGSGASNSSNDEMDAPTELKKGNGGVPRNARSFEDRNDKDESKEGELGDNFEIELFAADGDETYEVIQETTIDGSERSPPDVAEGNLLDL